MPRPQGQSELLKVGKKTCRVWFVFDELNPSSLTRPLQGLWVANISPLWRGKEFLQVLEMFLLQHYKCRLFKVLPPERDDAGPLPEGLYLLERIRDE